MFNRLKIVGSVAKKSVQYGVNFVVSVNTKAMNVVGLGDKFSKVEIYVTKGVSACAGSLGFGKGVADTIDALACADGVCAAVSMVGCAADGLQFLTSFIPGPNVTSVITIPVSVGCKGFVYCCKKGRVPWARFC